MTDNTELRDINAGNVNFGEQIFNGNVYIINGTVTQDKPTEQTRVFLSYARADDDSNYDDPAKSLLRRLTENLTNAAFAVWWDRKSLPSRSVPFSKEIETAIRDSDRFVLVVGPNASTSEWVRAELRYALELCKPITAILRAGDYDLMPVEIERINAIDFRAPRKYEDALKDLITRLGQPAPLGNMLNVKPLPTAHVRRAKAFDDAHAAICADAIAPTVISAPPRATAVFGYGGVGKSTLATALAHDCDVRRTFPDGVIWLEVGQTPNLSALQASIGATVFGDNRENYQDAHTGQLALSQILHGKTALIVLDDVWDHRIVAHFPIADTACRLLITTRSGALAKQIEGADIRLNLLSPEEGAALIAKRVGGAADDTVYKAISTALGGHTLAIALAAAQLANGYADNASDLLRLLTKRENPFAHLKLSDDDDEKTGDKNENLELSLSLSYKVLKPDLQRRFRLLGIFALESSFTRATLAAIWGDEDEDDSRAPLKTLLDSGLLEDSGNARYGQHRLLRIYARALLDEANELDDAAKRHFEHYSGLHGSEQDHTDTDYLQSITIDFENLYIAIEWGLKHATETGLDFIATLSNYLGVYQATAVYQPMLIDALTAAERVGYVEGQANTLRALGDLSVRQSELEAARAYYDRALPIYDQIGTRLGQANTLRALGDLSVRQSELEAARAYYDRALPIYDQIGTRLGQANTLRALGDLSVRQEELEAARAYYDRALPIYDQIGTRLGQANTLQALGDLSVRQEELEAARAYYDRALPIYDQIGTRVGQANTLRALGDLSVRQDELEAARAYYDRALPIYDQIDARLGQANTLRALGDLSVRQSELEAARAYYDRALPIYDQIDARLGQANTLMSLGDMLVKQLLWTDAIDYYEQALPIVRAIHDRLGTANILYDYGLALYEVGQTEAGIEALAECAALFEAIHFERWVVSAKRRLADLLRRSGRDEEANSITTPSDENAQRQQAIQALRQIYDHGGEAAVRQALQGQVEDVVIDQLIAQFENSPSTESEGNPDLLPKQTIEMLAGNSIAVKTGVAEKFAEWRAQVDELKTEWGEQGDDYIAETAFADALLAILDDQPTALAQDNPYFAVVQQVIETIQAYQKGN